MNLPDTIRPNPLRVLIAYLGSVVFAYTLATVFATQSVVLRLADMGVGLSLVENLHMVGHDLAGMTGIFLPLIAVGFAVAMALAGGLSRWQAHWRTAWFVLAGAAALLTIHAALKLTMEVTPVAVARSLPGLASQALAGALGGLAFVLIRPVKK